MVKESAGKVVGMPVAQFISNFLPLPDDSSRMKPFESGVFDELLHAKDLLENPIAEKWTDVVNRHNIAPGLTFVLTRYKWDEGDKTRERVDGAFFKDDVPTNGAPNWPDQIASVEFKVESKSKDPYHDMLDGSVVDAPAITRTAVRGQKLSYAEHIFAVQQRTAHISLIVMGRFYRAIRWDRSGAVVTPRTNYVKNSQQFCELLRRLALVRPEVLGFDPYAQRLKPGDEEYIRMTDASNAQDTDVVLSLEPVPTPVLTDPVDPKPTFSYVRDAFRNSITEDPLWPRYKISIPQNNGASRSFLVGKPTFIARGMFGRGTRGYVALDCSNDRFVFLKDAWRVDYPFMDCEGDVLAKLNDTADGQEAVCNVPTLVCHGDIDEQATQTPEIWEALHKNDKNDTTLQQPQVTSMFATTVLPTPPAHSSSTAPTPSPPPLQPSPQAEQSPGNLSQTTSPPCKNPFKPHKHYRIVVEEVGMPLSSFRNGRELVVAVYECVDAHYMATEKAKILHRDISAGNILLYPKLETLVDDENRVVGHVWVVGGLLTDWELAKCITVHFPRQPERTGTWQFMSVASLLEPGKALLTADEIESFFHVILYHAIRYLFHNCTDVYSFLRDYFDNCTYDGTVPLCGATKKAVITSGKVTHGTVPIQFRSQSSDSHPLNAIITDMLQRFKARYLALELANSTTPTPGDADDARSYVQTDAPIRTALKVVKRAPRMSLVAKKQKQGKTTAVIPDKPTLSEKDKELAASAETHDHFFGLLHDALADQSWPLDDKHGDHIEPILKNKRKKRELQDRDEMRDKRYRTASGFHVSSSQVMATISWSPSWDAHSQREHEDEIDAEQVEELLADGEMGELSEHE